MILKKETQSPVIENNKSSHLLFLYLLSSLQLKPRDWKYLTVETVPLRHFDISLFIFDPLCELKLDILAKQ